MLGPLGSVYVMEVKECVLLGTWGLSKYLL